MASSSVGGTDCRAELFAWRSDFVHAEALEKLTLFLRVPGAPLDNNICEGALKRAILHRKNALFYKTGHGAHVGDIFMSLIHTCESCGANPFDYLTELERHKTELAANPAEWMPWNYRETLSAQSTAPTA